MGKAENEGNYLAKVGILRATNRNKAKRLKARQKVHVTTRASKSVEAIIKQFASQELRSKKEKIQEWKENVMQTIGRKIEIINQTYKGSIKAPKRSFQLKLEYI